MLRGLFSMLAGVVVLLPLYSPLVAAEQPQNGRYEQNEVLAKAQAFFGAGAEGLADVVKKAFADQGRPNGYIEGEEAAGAIGVGVRYGQGTLTLHGGQSTQVFWQGPSVGFDVGANANKVFVLVYDLPRTEDIFKRFPGVSGSLYFIGGVGMHYLRSGDVNLAPIRFGMGWRQGVNVGYLHFTRTETLNPL